MDTQNSERSNKKDNNKIYFLLIVVLALFSTNAILFFRNQKSQDQVAKLSDEKTLMQTEIDKIEAELDKANNDYALLNEQMQKQQIEAREKIDRLREALRKGELTQKELTLAQEDVKQLRYFVNKYVADIEELKRQNALLTGQNDSLKTTVNTVTERAANLENQNRELDKKVKAAAALKAASISIIPVRIKSSGKESDVSKAANAQKLNVVFKLQNNEFAETGMHNVYVRVLDPQGRFAGNDLGKISLANGEEINVSYKTAIEFANDGKVYTIGWTNTAPFQKGTYTLTLYADGFAMGTTKINLK